MTDLTRTLAQHLRAKRLRYALSKQPGDLLTSIEDLETTLTATTDRTWSAFCSANRGWEDLEPPALTATLTFLRGHITPGQDERLSRVFLTLVDLIQCNAALTTALWLDMTPEGMAAWSAATAAERSAWDAFIAALAGANAINLVNELIAVLEREAA